MRKQITPLCALALLILAVVACKQLQSLTGSTVLRSPDGKFQLTVPAGWQERPSLHQTAGIKAANIFQETYVIVITENKFDFADDMTLDKFTDITRQAMLQKAVDSNSTEPAPVTINGIEGRQYELDGVVNSVKISYLVTALETATNYHQVITWTLLSRKTQNHPTLKKVTESFRAT